MQDANGSNPRCTTFEPARPEPKREPVGVERLRRERNALRLACRMLVTDGADLARLVERARATLGAGVDPALLAWARCVVAARGAIDGTER